MQQNVICIVLPPPTPSFYRPFLSSTPCLPFKHNPQPSSVRHSPHPSFSTDFQLKSLWFSLAHPCKSGWTYLPVDSGTARTHTHAHTHTHTHTVVSAVSVLQAVSKGTTERRKKLSYTRRITLMFKSWLQKLMPCTIFYKYSELLVFGKDYSGVWMKHCLKKAPREFCQCCRPDEENESSLYHKPFLSYHIRQTAYTLYPVSVSYFHRPAGCSVLPAVSPGVWVGGTHCSSLSLFSFFLPGNLQFRWA